ncbi:hypothetical protein VOLCADRAFT_120629 [Volvox carteri f. nagariensis]|uniref:Uncharacterized protein n=1 Tax=Volvox carteri f. nagariensis TaxID=3068 RepID=D8TQ18_VOLCA|nr:uncharacterized protein VOLCADRAFT_120629 [Volvox carteri f. nagariensis]EFJ50459.1 hypothetical protein VOLCADRAFT_120629 [Volvox carteri f. nagariensis]|eukprot:XP_002948584.1 hypothetical protein VOLCADRAFT_120629 [Volvox carteri f. nagariensis]
MQLQAFNQSRCKPAGLVRGSRHAFIPIRCSAASSYSCNAASSSSAGRLPLTRPARPSMGAPRPLRRSTPICQSVANGKLISSTEVPAFIPRDDMMDQLFRWSMMEAGESGQRNFGMPMTIAPVYYEERLWGFNVSIFKEGVKLTDLGVMFDKNAVTKHEWVGRGEDGFPVMEGKSDEVKGKNFEICPLFHSHVITTAPFHSDEDCIATGRMYVCMYRNRKLDSDPVTEDLRATIRAYCTALVAALNRYYAFGSVFVDDAQ